MQLLPNKYVGVSWGTPAEAEGGGEGESEGEGAEALEGEGAEASEGEEESYDAINGYEPSDLRGSLTLEQTASMLNLPLTDVYARLGLPADYPSGATLKDAAADMGLGLSDFKHQLFD